MPRPLFTANRQSANTLIWRRFDPFRPYRLLLWLIAAPIGYGYTATLLALYAKNLGGGTAWLAWYPLIYTAVLALVCHRSLIRLLWNPPILVCDENGLTAFNEYGRWLGQWQWAQIAELRATRQPGDYYTLEVIMHGDTPPRPAPDETAPAHDLARYGQSYRCPNLAPTCRKYLTTSTATANARRSTPRARKAGRGTNTRAASSTTTGDSLAGSPPPSSLRRC